MLGLNAGPPSADFASLNLSGPYPPTRDGGVNETDNCLWQSLFFIGVIMAEKKKDVSKLKFEEAVDALTEIVRGIEGGEIELEASLEQYERGMGLIKHCRGILEKAEKRIEKISAENKAEEDAEEEEESGSELF